MFVSTKKCPALKDNTVSNSLKKATVRLTSPNYFWRMQIYLDDLHVSTAMSIKNLKEQCIDKLLKPGWAHAEYWAAAYPTILPTWVLPV